MPSVSLPDASFPDVEWQGAGGSLPPAGKRAGERAVEFSPGNLLDLAARGRGKQFGLQLFSWFATA